MNEQRLHNEVVKCRKKLKRSVDGSFPRETWDFLEEQGVLLDATDMFDEEGVKYVVRWMDKLDVAAPGGLSRRSGQQESPPEPAEENTLPGEEREEYFRVDLGDYERDRQQVFFEVMAKQVGMNKEADEFRKTVLGNQLLTPDQAYELLESPAARYFRTEFFEAMGTPITGHTAKVVAEDIGWGKPEIDHRVAVKIDPPGEVKRAQYAPEWVALPEDEVVHSRTCSYADPERRQPKHPNERPLNYRDSDGFKATVYPWPGTLLDGLRQRSNRLAKVLGWSEEEMVWTLLTGEAPKITPLKANVKFSRGKPATITMEAAAWLPAKVLTRNFQELQRQVLGESGHELPSRSLAVFRFVEQHTNQQGGRPSLRQLWAKWNATNTAQTYQSYTGFSQTYRRTRNKVLQSYRVPETKPSPAVERRYKEFVERFSKIAEGHIERHGNRFLEAGE